MSAIETAGTQSLTPPLPSADAISISSAIGLVEAEGGGFGGSVGWLGVIGLLFPFIWVLQSFGDWAFRKFGDPIGAIFSLIGIFVFIICIVLLRRKMRRREDAASEILDIGILAKQPDITKRVWCVGSRSQIAAIVKADPLSNTRFEPLVFRQTSHEIDARMGWMYFFVLIVVGLGSYMAFRHIIAKEFVIYVSGLCGAIAGWQVTPFLLPRYTRVTPGKIEILTYGFLGRGKPRVDCVDLSKSRVVVNLAQNEVEVMPLSAGGKTMLKLDSSQIEKLAHAILLAAISTAEVPRLPEDELVG